MARHRQLLRCWRRLGISGAHTATVSAPLASVFVNDTIAKALGSNVRFPPEQTAQRLTQHPEADQRQTTPLRTFAPHGMDRQCHPPIVLARLTLRRRSLNASAHTLTFTRLSFWQWKRAASTAGIRAQLPMAQWFHVEMVRDSNDWSLHLTEHPPGTEQQIETP